MCVKTLSGLMTLSGINRLYDFIAMETLIVLNNFP